MLDPELVLLIGSSILLILVFVGFSTAQNMITIDSYGRDKNHDPSLNLGEHHSDWMMVFILGTVSSCLGILSLLKPILLLILGGILFSLVSLLESLIWINALLILACIIGLSSFTQRMIGFLTSKTPAQLLPLIELNTVIATAPIVGIKLLLSKILSVRLIKSIPSRRKEDINDSPVSVTESEEMTMTVDTLDAKERRMILGVLDLDSTAVREVMVPRVDLSAADVNSTIGEIRDLVITSGHSRILIYDGNIDSVIGTIHARDLLKNFDDDSNLPLITDIVRNPFFIPDAKRVDDLLDEMQASRIHIAIVVDEYGGTAGIVTLEDLLEEIVGEIADEFTNDEPILKMVNEQEALVDARVTLDQINEALSLKILPNGFETVGGLVYQQLGKMPKTGDVVNCEGLKIKVLSTTGRRIKILGVSKIG